MARQRGKYWQGDVKLPDGTRSRPTFDTQAQAEEWEQETREAVRLGKPLPKANKKIVEGSHLIYLGPLFDHVARTEWASMRAAKGLTTNGRLAVEYFGRKKRVAEITSVEIAEYRTSLAEGGNAAATINRKTAALSKMLRVAMEAGIITAVPRIRWSAEAQTKFRYLDETEEARLLAYWDLREDNDLRDLTVFLIDTGARCFAEALPLRWDHFNTGLTAVTFWHTKTNRPRTVPLTKRCVALLAKRKAARGNGYGPFSGVNRNTMRDRWDAMRTALSFPDVTPHTLRHTCCTRLVLGGVDIKRVMVWMGHTAIVTTMRYMQIKPTGLEDVLHVLEPQTV